MASAKVIRELLVKLGVKTDPRGLAKFDAGIKAAKTNALKLAGVAVAVGGGLLAIVANTAKVGDEAAKQGKRIGVTAEAIQEWDYIMERSGTTGAAWQKGIKTQSQLIRELKLESLSAVDTFKDLNVTYQDLKGLKPEDQFRLLVEQMKGITDQGDQIAIASKLWGRAGIELLPLINDQTTSLQDLTAAARENGIVSNETAAMSEKFMDTWLDVKRVIKGVGFTIGEVLMPQVQRGMDGFKEWHKQNKEFIQIKIRAWAEKLARAVKALGDRLVDLDQWVKNSLGGWETLLMTMVKLVTVLAEVKVGWMVLGPILEIIQGGFIAVGAVGLPVLGAIAVFLGMIILPAIAWAAAIAAVVLPLQDLYVWLKGGDSLIGRWIDKNRDAEGAMGSLARLMETVGELIGVIWAKAADAVVEAWGVIEPTVTRILNVMEKGARFVGGEIDDALAGGIDNVAKAVEFAIELVKDWDGTWARLFETIRAGSGAVEFIAQAFGAIPGVPGRGGSPAAAGAGGGLRAPTIGQVVSPLTAVPYESRTDVGGDTFNIDARGSNPDALRQVLMSEAQRKARTIAQHNANGE